MVCVAVSEQLSVSYITQFDSDTVFIAYDSEFCHLMLFITTVKSVIIVIPGFVFEGYIASEYLPVGHRFALNVATPHTA